MSQLAAMGSGEYRCEQCQARRASWTRLQWYSGVQVADAVLYNRSQLASQLRALSQWVGGQSREVRDWEWQVKLLYCPERPARSQTPKEGEVAEGAAWSS
jgi:hypothetical protein